MRIHLSLRNAMAKLVGMPVTSEFLGGTADLSLAGLIWPPSGTDANMTLPHGMVGDNAQSRASWIGGMPPRYELEAWVLSEEIQAAIALEDRPVASPVARVGNVSRWLLSLPFWREHIFENQSHGSAPVTMREESARFAYHLSEAIRVLLSPWLRGEVTMRRNLVRRMLAGLDLIAVTNEDIHFELSSGRLSDLAIRDEANGFAHDLRGGLLAVLRLHRDELRSAGIGEAEIARRIREGEPDDEGVPYP